MSGFTKKNTAINYFWEKTDWRFHKNFLKKCIVSCTKWKYITLHIYIFSYCFDLKKCILGENDHKWNISRQKGLSASCCTMSKILWARQPRLAIQSSEQKSSKNFYRFKLKRSSRWSYKYLWSYTLDHPKWQPGWP